MSRVLDVAEWVGRNEFNRAPLWARQTYVRECAARLREAKIKQVQSGIGADGRQLRRVKPTSRPDGTTDRPLHPHDDASRAIRLLRAVGNPSRGTVTFHWQYFTRIIGYHADGDGKPLPRRDIFGTPGRFLRPVRRECVAIWRRLVPATPVSPTAGEGFFRRLGRLIARGVGRLVPGGRLPAEVIRNPVSPVLRVFD